MFELRQETTTAPAAVPGQGASRRRPARRDVLLALLALAPLLPGSAAAQSPLRPAVEPPPPPGSPPWLVTAGPEYRAGAFTRFFLGDGYRELWTTPLQAPVLDLEAYAGGLRPIRVGGGFQTQTIHLRGGDDGYYLFRSVNKAVRKGLPEDLRDTPAGRIVQDQTSALHPAGAWVIPPLLEAVGVPHERPELFLMPDDPALGDHREAFAGVLGMLVRSPDMGESGELSWDGSDEILGSEDLLERLEASPADRVDARNLLAARLVDFVVGDPDRNFDNHRWLGYRSEDGTTVWRAVPMDRDPAFLKADGLLGTVARKSFLPKYVNYGPDFGHVKGLWVSQPEIDRLFLAGLDRSVWDSVVVAVQAALTDDVIDRAASSLPPEYRPVNAGFLASGLRGRREALPEAAEAFYLELAAQVDVQATGSPDVAEVVCLPDGSMDVSLHAGCAPRVVAQDADDDGGDIVCRQTYFERRFVPSETREVRVHLRGGHDRALVGGEGPQPIRLRVIGGEGDDVLEDRSRAQGPARTVFHDHQGDDRFLSGPETRVDRGAWDRPVITDFLAEKDGDLDYRDWGSGGSWRPVVEYEERAGVIVGVRRTSTTYGFRRLPWARRVEVTGLLGTRGPLNAVGGQLRVQKRLEASDVILSGTARAATNLWSYRFHGYGNDTPLLDSELSLVPADEVRVQGSVEVPLGERGSVALGPVVRWLSTAPHPDGPAADDRPRGWDGFGQVGAQGSLDARFVDDRAFPRLGVALLGSASAYAPVWDARDWFGGADGELRGYLPLPAGSALAARVGGGLAWGPIPVHESVFLGGRRNLRGYRFERFAGDAALYGGGELRVPLGSLTLFTRGTVGAFGFGDAGRVWVEGESEGDWHAGYGGGLWYATMGVSGSVAWAQGEEGKLYLFLGLPF